MLMNDTTELLKQLMEFRPVSADRARVNKAVEFMHEYLAGAGLYTIVEDFKGLNVLYAAARKTKTPAILFNAHLDVVPADDATFRYRERGGWVWGRGSGDCLGNCAVLARMLVQAPKGADVGVIFSSDEEIGGESVVHMIKKGFRGKLIIIMDTISPGHEITLAHKGMLTLRLIAKGKTCHGSSPWLGKNAIDRLIEGYGKIKHLFPRVKPGDEWHTTCSANIISAGSVFNRVPDQAEMTLDIRFTCTPAEARKLVAKVRSASGLKVKVETFIPGVMGDENNRLLSELRAFMSDRLKRPIGVTRMNAATDARHFRVLKAPIAMMGIPYKNPHGADERANIKGMLTYQEMLTDLCRTGLPGLAAKC